MVELVVPDSGEWQWLLHRVLDANSLESLRLLAGKLGSAPDCTTCVFSQGLGKLIALARRANRWSVEKLAAQADIDEESLHAIEAGDTTRLDPRALVYLATALKLPVEILLELAEFAEPSTPDLREAAMRLVAQPVVVKPRDAPAALRRILNALGALHWGGHSCAGRLDTKRPHHKEYP